MPTRSKKTQPESDQSKASDGVFELVYGWVVQIPSGRVMTYGQISRLIDERLSAVGVGWALKACPYDERRIPWHRVVNAQGTISTRRILPGAPNLQQELLESEGIEFDASGKLDLQKYQWFPDDEPSSLESEPSNA